MKLIRDIRLFESDEPNVDRNSIPYYIGKIYHYDHMDCLDVIQRLLFLLRHRGFCYDGFDHLYLNLTPCLPHGEMRNTMACSRFELIGPGKHKSAQAERVRLHLFKSQNIFSVPDRQTSRMRERSGCF